jgi:type I restriction enzyme S subunit
MSADNNSIPRTWVLTTLGGIVQPTRPRHSPQDFAGLRFIGMEHIEAHTMKLLGTVSAGTMRSSAVHFQPGDVLYGRLRPYLNKVFCPDFEGLCSAEFIVFPESGHLNSKFIQYLLNSADFVSFASHLNAGDRPRVDFDQIAPYRVALPPLPEQRRIVAEIEKQFTRLEAAVGALKRVQANLKRYRAAVLKAAVEGRLVPTEAELARTEGRSYEPADQLLQRILVERRARWEADQLAKLRASGKEPKDDKWKQKYTEPPEPEIAGLPELPQGWVWSSIGQLFEVHVGATPSRAKPEYWNGDISWVSSGEVAFCRIRETREKITQLGLENSSTELHPPGTVLLGMIGEGKTRGQAAILEIEACNNQNSAAIRVSQSGLPPEYLYYYLQGRYEQTRRMSSGGNQPALNRERVKAISVPLPPLAEQERIVTETERRFSVIDELEMQVEANLKRAERLRQAILKRAFEGKLVPQDPADEPASVLLERIRAEREAKMQVAGEAKRGRRATHARVVPASESAG